MPLRRNMVTVCILFLAGILLAGHTPLELPPPLLVFLLAAALVLMLILLKRNYRDGRSLSPTMLSLLFTLAGFLYSLSYQAFHPNLLTEFYDRQVVVSGIVDDIPIFMNDKWQYTVAADQLIAGDDASRTALKLKDRIRISHAGRLSAVSYGDRVEISGRLVEPQPARNPGGYDDQAYLARQGIHARVSTREGDSVQRTGHVRSLYGMTIAPLRDGTWKVIQKLFPPGEAELAGGLVIGFKSDLPEAWKAAFQLLGITHILAASGMNVGLISGALFYLFKRLRIAKRIAAPTVIGIIILYVLLAGAGPSVVRAGCMAVLLIMGSAVGRRTDVVTIIALAALILLLWNPGSTSDIGFILSFVTTLGLFLITPPLERRLPGPSSLRTAVAVTLAAQISSLPVILFYFNQISPLSLLANLYIMPLTFLLVPFGFGLILLGFIHAWLALPFVGMYRILLWLLLKPLVWAAEAAGGWAWNIGSPPVWMVWLIYAGLLLVIVWKKAVRWFRAQFTSMRQAAVPFVSRIPAALCVPRLAAAVCVLLVAVLAVYHWPERGLRVTFLDVGQGDCALIEGPAGTRILVDGGGIPTYLESDFDVGAKTVLPFLRHRGVNKLDFVVATHADEDHIRGLITVIQTMQVSALIVSGYADPAPAYRELLQAARQRGIAVHRTEAGSSWELEPGLSWRFLHPGNLHTGTRSDTNANSVVFELDYGQRKFLFTGDIEGEVERDLQADARQVDVLKVSHHGSLYSTTADFLQWVQPRYAVISSGKRNRYGHPHQETLGRLKQAGAAIFRTDLQGAVTFRTDGENLQVETAIPSRGQPPSASSPRN